MRALKERSCYPYCFTMVLCSVHNDLFCKDQHWGTLNLHQSLSACNVHAFLHYSDRTFRYKLWSLEPTFCCLRNDCRLLINKSLLPEVQCFRIAKGYSTRFINLELKLKMTVMTTCKLHVCLTLVRKTKFLQSMYYWTYDIEDRNHLGWHRPMLLFSKSMDTTYLCGSCITFHFNRPAGFVDLLVKKKLSGHSLYHKLSLHKCHLSLQVRLFDEVAEGEKKNKKKKLCIISGCSQENC